MKKKIRTANETITGMVFPIVFTIVWVSLIGYQFIRNGFQESLMVIFLIGLILPMQSLKIVRDAFKYRQVHEHFLKNYKPQKGRIVNITKAYPEEKTGNGKKICYYLDIDMLNAGGQPVRRVKSEGYYLPLHKYLASPEVDVYFDNKIKYTVVDGFHLKENETDPDLIFENSNVNEEIEKPKKTVEPIVKYVWIGAGVLIAIQILLMIFWK